MSLFEATSLFETLNLKFDESGNITLSRKKLIAIISEVKAGNIFSENNPLPDECYVIVDKSLHDFYPFPAEELEEWERDGSCRNTDALYKMTLVKTY